ENLLAKETSPYLLLHKDNPVHWRPWGPAALAEAKAANKPIFLSVGYSACHWCHVMNHESFADPEIAALMNSLYVNVKVDREERPDIDQLYQAASIQMGHSGGWPLTMFLTPEGKPFLAGGYLGPIEAPDRPTMKRALTESSRVYREDPERVTKTSETVDGMLEKLWGRDVRTSSLPVSTLEYAAIRIGQSFDIFYGGVIGAPKFPSCALVEFLFRGYLRTGAPPLQQLARTAVDAMSLGGMYDHVGGGFHRYSTDERWLVPHFEKMLYDNAAIVDLLTTIWQNNRHALYSDRVEETIAWMLREMRAGDGFASSIDADSEGEEGRYYIWTEPEIDAALAGTFAQRFKQVYNISRNGNFMGRNIPHRLGTTVYPFPEADETLFRKQRELLLAARQKRVAPMRDEKILTDWNGMAIVALAHAGTAMRRPEWVKEASKTFAFIVKSLGDGDRLYHSLGDGKRQHIGFSDDYAQMAYAALALYDATGEKHYLEHAQGWVKVLDKHFWDSRRGGYFTGADDDEPLIMRVRMAADQSHTSANGTMVSVLAHLYLMTGDMHYRDRSNAVLQAFAGDIGDRFMAFGAYLNGLDTVMSNLQIVIVGARGNAKTQELIAAVRGRSLPSATLIVADPGEKYADPHPAFGKTMQGGVPTAYICQYQNCSAPITSPVALSQMLQMPAQSPAGRA
ncbi:MAG TPA: thioredoxin domain-containing protein, partial [Rhizomicrobium sp.]|nr:thioredoxin domain-containing protein [Rhizomicrobium sp.]